MDDSATVACDACGHEVGVYRYAVGSVALLDPQLPIGWDIYEELDQDSGRRRIIVLCPVHKAGRRDRDAQE